MCSTSYTVQHIFLNFQTTTEHYSTNLHLFWNAPFAIKFWTDTPDLILMWKVIIYCVGGWKLYPGFNRTPFVIKNKTTLPNKMISTPVFTQIKVILENFQSQIWRSLCLSKHCKTNADLLYWNLHFTNNNETGTMILGRKL